MEGLFGDMFDFNGDGDLDVFEQTMEFAFLNEIMNEEKDADIFDEEDDIFDKEDDIFDDDF